MKILMGKHFSFTCYWWLSLFWLYLVLTTSFLISSKDPPPNLRQKLGPPMTKMMSITIGYQKPPPISKPRPVANHQGNDESKDQLDLAKNNHHSIIYKLISIQSALIKCRSKFHDPVHFNLSLDCLILGECFYPEFAEKIKQNCK